MNNAEMEVVKAIYHELKSYEEVGKTTSLSRGNHRTIQAREEFVEGLRFQILRVLNKETVHKSRRTFEVLDEDIDKAKVLRLLLAASFRVKSDHKACNEMIVRLKEQK